MTNPNPTTVNKKIIILTTILVIASIAFSGILATNLAQSPTASAKISAPEDKIGIYADSTCKQQITTLDWGAIPQGAQTNKTIYIKNQYNTNLKLYMTTSNWNPTNAENAIAVTWNLQDATLKRNQVLQATITVEIAQDTTITDFEMDIAITGTATK